MHLLTTSSATLDDLVEAVDLGQPPGDIAVLSFVDSDLSGLAAAWQAEREGLPSVRLAHLRELRHPMSVDLWIDRVGAHAKVILVRLLGGLDWWTYGIERLSALARERGIGARRAARRGPRRCAAGRGLDIAARRARCAAGLFPRGRPRKSARALAPACPSCRLRSRKSPNRGRCRACAGYLPGEGAVDLDRLALRSSPASRSCRSSSIAPCCSPPIPRRSMRFARRWLRAALRRRRWLSRA